MRHSERIHEREKSAHRQRHARLSSRGNHCLADLVGLTGLPGRANVHARPLLALMRNALDDALPAHASMSLGTIALAVVAARLRSFANSILARGSLRTVDAGGLHAGESAPSCVANVPRRTRPRATGANAKLSRTRAFQLVSASGFSRRLRLDRR